MTLEEAQAKFKCKEWSHFSHLLKKLNMHESLCIWALIESISGIKIEIIQQEQDKGKVVFKK